MRRAGCGARHRAWNDLPAPLMAQIEDYLLPVERLVDRARPPVLLHTDLN
ncbi:MAG TPA: hypothetical protein VFJ58_04275 [Armatimonadota bacterium]|nr:hypothetical protein [Armatimonadota bacterium]